MNERHKDLLTSVAHATNIQEGREGVRNIVRAIYQYGPIRTRDVSIRTHIPIPVISAVRRELECRGILIRKNGMALSAEGILYAQNTLMLSTLTTTLTKHDLIDPTFVVPEELQDVLHDLRQFVAKAPRYDPTVDQAPCTAETSLRRALLMFLSGAIEGKRIFIVGDDDLVSVAIYRLAEHFGVQQSVKHIAVVDVDHRILRHIAAIAEKRQYPIETILHDLRKPLSGKYRDRFDVFETDPPYTVNGLRLFLSRAIEALRSDVGSGQHGYLSFAHWPADKKFELEQMLYSFGLSIENQYRGFNRYQGASILGSTSSLFELMTTSRTRSTLSDTEFTGNLYTADT